jgi:hypothetical protein
VLQIRISFNADPDTDPDQAFLVNADPDPYSQCGSGSPQLTKMNADPCGSATLIVWRTNTPYEIRVRILPLCNSVWIFFLLKYVMLVCSVADPDPYVFGPTGSASHSTDPDPALHQAKIVRKTLISPVL